MTDSDSSSGSELTIPRNRCLTVEESHPLSIEIPSVLYQMIARFTSLELPLRVGYVFEDFLKGTPETSKFESALVVGLVAEISRGMAASAGSTLWFHSNPRGIHHLQTQHNVGWMAGSDMDKLRRCSGTAAEPELRRMVPDITKRQLFVLRNINTFAFEIFEVGRDEVLVKKVLTDWMGTQDNNMMTSCVFKIFTVVAEMISFMIVDGIGIDSKGYVQVDKNVLRKYYFRDGSQV
jgi:hypothetical protein